MDITAFVAGMMIQGLIITAAISIFPKFFTRQNRAEAWDEGWKARADQVGNYEKIRNPYRKHNA